MTKEELHSFIQCNQGKLEINELHFIAIYGEDRPRTIQGVETTRADMLARTHNQSVSKVEDNYIFTRN